MRQPQCCLPLATRRFKCLGSLARFFDFLNAISARTFLPRRNKKSSFVLIKKVLGPRVGDRLGLRADWEYA